MTAIRKFLFDTSFDLYRPPMPAEVEEEPEPEPEEPSFSAEELEATRREAFEAGRAEGNGEAMAGIEQNLSTSLEAVRAQLDALIAHQRQGAETRRAEAMEVALEALGTLFPCLQKNFGFAEIEAAIGEALRRLEVEPRVVIRVTDEMIDPLRERLPDLAEGNGFDGKLVLVPDGELNQGSVRIEWASGGAECDSARVWQELQTLIDERVTALRKDRSTSTTTTDEGQSPDQAAQVPA